MRTHNVSHGEERACERQVGGDRYGRFVSRDTHADHSNQDGAWKRVVERAFVSGEFDMCNLLTIEIKETTLRYEIPSSVLGIVKTRHTTAVTTAQTTEHDAPSVTVAFVHQPNAPLVPRPPTYSYRRR